MLTMHAYHAYHVTCVVTSVHLNLDSDPIYGCTDEPPTLALGWTLSLTIVDHIYTPRPNACLVFLLKTICVFKKQHLNPFDHLLCKVFSQLCSRRLLVISLRSLSVFLLNNFGLASFILHSRKAPSTRLQIGRCILGGFLSNS